MTLSKERKQINVRLYSETIELVKRIREAHDIPYCDLSLTSFIHWYLKEHENC